MPEWWLAGGSQHGSRACMKHSPAHYGLLGWHRVGQQTCTSHQQCGDGGTQRDGYDVTFNRDHEAPL